MPIGGIANFGWKGSYPMGRVSFFLHWKIVHCNVYRTIPKCRVKGSGNDIKRQEFFGHFSLFSIINYECEACFGTIAITPYTFALFHPCHHDIFQVTISTHFMCVSFSFLKCLISLLLFFSPFFFLRARKKQNKNERSSKQFCINIFSKQKKEENERKSFENWGGKRDINLAQWKMILRV